MKSGFLLLVTSLFTIVNCCAQPLTHGNIYLEKYSWSAGDKVVGKIGIIGNATSVFALKGLDANNFRIDKDNRLQVRNVKRAKPEGSVLIIEARSNDNFYSDTFLILQNRFIQNKVIAHRGAWKHTGAAQNSIASFEQAVKLGCEGSEFDVRLSSDNVVVLSHDPKIQELDIDKTPSQELLKLKLSNGEFMPTLESFLQAGMKQYSTKMILEIKPNGMDSLRLRKLTSEVLSLVKKYKAQAWVVYISFSYNALLHVKELDPAAQIVYLNGDKSPELLARDKFYGLDYNFAVMQKNPSWIDIARQNQITVNVWTVNDPEMMSSFLEKKVDFLTTDEPEILLQKIKP